MYRTHTCWQLTAKNIWENIIISWWVNKIRNLWWMTFIDLRDRYWITQITYDPSKHDFKLPEIKSEYVLKIFGIVVSRPENMINKDITTGEIEISPTQIHLLSDCKELPFPIDHESPVWEDIRLEYRYLDLRRQTMKENIIARHKIFTETIKFFDKEDFLHIETPAFVKNTPEWSREFVVPARFDPGKFFVLPQSPQQQKQMLMVAGMDKYVQIARCFRDEDPRGDRQPEFTQVDFEMSFCYSTRSFGYNRKILY
jgi:aspartyl-tRNA synthetase